MTSTPAADDFITIAARLREIEAEKEAARRCWQCGGVGVWMGKECEACAEGDVTF